MDDQRPQPAVHRIITGGFGVFFLAVAIIIVVVSEASLGTLTAAILVGGLGLDAILAALRNKKSLLGRIGPLP